VCEPSRVASVFIYRAGARRIPELEPLWHALYEHHAEIGDSVAPMRDFAESWRRRRAQYEAWLESDDAVLLVAERDRRAIGYAMVTIGDGPATWDLGDRTLVIETLAVLPEERGAGVGHALLEEAERVAREGGADTMAVGLVHTNDAARSFYEREAFGLFYMELVADLRGDNLPQ
jgi:ribosomal protein S18 acetylase RimI-like enzyme